jgi:hypothetical protein
MKKCTVLVLFLCLCFPLAAQSRPYPLIFVAPVTGTGSKPDENFSFYKLLVYELSEQNYSIAKTQAAADYSLIATIAPQINEHGTPVLNQYVFRLEVKDNKAGEVTVDGELLYEVPDDVNNLFPVLIDTLLSTIPEEMGKKDDWCNKWLYFGGSVFWTPRAYIGDEQSTLFVNFGGGISAEYQFLDFMSAEMGFQFASDWVAAFVNNHYRNILLEIPLLVKYVAKPSAHFMLEPYAGIHVNVPFYRTTKPPALSCLLGFQYGVKTGPGVFFVDPRLAIDIGKSTVEALPGSRVPHFQRYIIHFSIGYKYGIFQKG